MIIIKDINSNNVWTNTQKPPFIISYTLRKLCRARGAPPQTPAQKAMCGYMHEYQVIRTKIHGATFTHHAISRISNQRGLYGRLADKYASSRQEDQ